MAGIGGAAGLGILLRNVEASAAGTPPPPRLLVTFWPIGTIRYKFLPTTTATGFTYSPILSPIEAAGLRNDTIILYGLTRAGIVAGGGGDERGTVTAVTGVATVGNRKSALEADDTMAGGPSFDQIFLKRAPSLAQSGLGFINAIGDSRVDAGEIAPVCLSYGYDKVSTPTYAGTSVDANIPLLPELGPLQVYMKLFGSFVPGASVDLLARARKRKKSVLDFALRQLAQVRTLSPVAQRDRIDAHADAIRRLEQQLDQPVSGGGACTVPTPPDAAFVGRSGTKNHYSSVTSDTPEDDLHDRVGALHLNIIRAAFQCDLLRVATFQWSSAQSQVAFGGLHESYPDLAVLHHPLSHRIQSSSVSLGMDYGNSAPDIAYLTNVHTWYNQKTAAALAQFKKTTDVFGGNLLDHTVVPFVTDIAESAHGIAPIPALIFGGKALGMKGGQFLDMTTSKRPHNDLWLTVGQAFFPDSNVMTALKGEAFLAEPSTSSGPIEGLWAKPGV